MPRTLTPEDVESFRARLCDVAEMLFAERGPDAVSMRALADAAGVSRMTPYTYFDDKAAILAAVRARGFNRLADATDAAAAATDDPWLRLRDLGRAYLGFAAANPDAYRVMYAISQTDEDRYPDLVEAVRRSQQALLDAVTAAHAAGLVDGDPLDAVHVLWAGLHGLNALHLADKLKLGRDPDHLADVMLRALGRGIAA